jgi:hypothetical protein
MAKYSSQIEFINNHNFRPHKDYNWGLFGLLLTSGPDSTILVYEPETNQLHNIWRFVGFPGSHRYIANYVNGIGEVRTFDFSRNNTYKATTRLEEYVPLNISNTITASIREDESSDNEEEKRF